MDSNNEKTYRDWDKKGNSVPESGHETFLMLRAIHSTLTDNLSLLQQLAEAKKRIEELETENKFMKKALQK